MNCTLYIPYSIGDPKDGFKYNGGQELSQRKYIELMTDDYNAYKDSVDMVVGNVYYGGSGSFGYSMTNSGMKKTNFMSKYNKDGYVHQNYEYYTCECSLFDMKGNDESIDNLIEYYKKREQFIVIMEIKNLEKNPDLETEFKMWIKESNHINNSRRLTTEEKLFNLPKKDMKIAFPNSKSSAILKECKIMEIYSNSSYAVLVNKILFYKN